MATDRLPLPGRIGQRFTHRPLQPSIRSADGPGTVVRAATIIEAGNAIRRIKRLELTPLRLKALIVALSLACLTQDGFAQTASSNSSGVSVQPGSRVRVHSVTLVSPLIANFLEQRGDTLVFIEDGTGRGVWSFSLAQIDKLEITGGRTGRSSSAIKKGAIIGAGIGLAAGLLFANTFDPSDPTRDFDAGPTGIVGAAAGAGLGVFIGSRISTERWVNIPLPQRMSFAPNGRGLTLSFSFR